MTAAHQSLVINSCLMKKIGEQNMFYLDVPKIFSIYCKMRFAWDEAKAASNLIKHGVSFKLAITAFDDPHALMALDDQHSRMEQREWLIGQSDKGILVVIFTRRVSGTIFRIISARRANRKERKLYEEYKTISL